MDRTHMHMGMTHMNTGMAHRHHMDTMMRPRDDTHLRGGIHQFDRRHDPTHGHDVVLEYLRRENEKQKKREIKRDQLRPGDHIYTWRLDFRYSHHGIYMGDDMGDDRVVHYYGLVSAGSLSSSSSSSRSPCSACKKFEYSDRELGVIVTCLDCFLHSGGIWRYEYGISETDYDERRRGTCNTAESGPVETVLQRAEGYLRSNGFGEYDLLNNNCEDFATFCKTGQKCDRNGTAPKRYGQAAQLYSCHIL